MTERSFFLDESGDLGWKFTAPYRQGGSSRHLTISTLSVCPSKKHLPKRLLKKLYEKYSWPAKEEKKWSAMTAGERLAFATAAASLASSNPEHVKYLSITVRKECVLPHIRTDENKLYNYMIGLSLLPEMAQYQRVVFIPDPRSIKVQSGNSLHDYLQTKLWFDHGCPCALTTQACDSAQSTNVQFADMLSGVVQSHFEDGNSAPWLALRRHIAIKTLFF